MLRTVNKKYGLKDDMIIWKLLYLIMRYLGFHYPRMAMWVIMEKLHIVDRLSDEGYHKLSLLAFSNEVFRMPWDGGGINSLIKWQMLYWKSDIPSIGCDRIAVREYVASRVGTDVLVPLLPYDGSCWDDPDDIDFMELPQKFVLKCTNGSGLLKVVTDKSTIDINEVRNTMKGWLLEKPSLRFREFQYGHVKNKIICEEYIGDADGKCPIDYKIMCSNGKPLFAWIDFDRFTKHSRVYVDLDFNIVDCHCSFCPKPDINSLGLFKPYSWDRMLAVAAKLSEGIPIVRVDLYCVSGKVYFGELTFSSEGGLDRIIPFSCSQKWARETDISSFTTE